MATETNTATQSLHRFRHGKQNINHTNKKFSKGGFCFNLNTQNKISCDRHFRGASSKASLFPNHLGSNDGYRYFF